MASDCGFKPLFRCRWDQTLMAHFDVPEAWVRQRCRFELDRWGGRALVSLVAFTMRDVELAPAGRAGRWLCRPFCPVRFLNVRTYVRVGGQPGIYFITEWLSSRLTVLLEPALFGLPYCFGRSRYTCDADGRFAAVVRDASERHTLRITADGCRSDGLAPCSDGSCDAFLMERYVAFSDRGRASRCFHVWHEPWPQTSGQVRMENVSLLRHALDWPADAMLIGGNYSPGVDALVGRPCRISKIRLAPVS